MIYVTGDTHGDIDVRLSVHAFPEQREMNKDDVVIICGDCGLIWDYKGLSKREKYLIDWLEEKPFTTLFIDGNHECFDRLLNYPQKKWNGGMVHEISPSVLHLQRGEVFNIQDKKIFTFGGAKSHDIQCLLRKDSPSYEADKKHFKLMGAFYREEGKTWWPQEMPTRKEMANGLINLEKSENKVDFIFTHDCPSSDLMLLASYYEIDELNQYLEDIRCKVDYKKWFFGHHHMNKAINDKEICLFEQIIRIA